MLLQAGLKYRLKDICYLNCLRMGQWTIFSNFYNNGHSYDVLTNALRTCLHTNSSLLVHSLTPTHSLARSRLLF